jgi:hypothetical protein
MSPESRAARTQTIMNAVVVGADRLGNIPNALAGFGIQIHRHVTGRSSAHQRSVGALPQGTELLILFTDFLNHNAMKCYRGQAQAQGIPVIACKRSASCLVQSVKRHFGVDDGCAACPQREPADVRTVRN